jgi:hypothetical protein
MDIQSDTHRVKYLFLCSTLIFFAACSTTNPSGDTAADTVQIDVAQDTAKTKDTKPVTDTALGEASAPDSDTVKAPDTTVADSATLSDTTGPDTQQSDLPDGSPTSDTASVGPFSIECTEDQNCIFPCAKGKCAEGLCTFSAPQDGCVIIDPVKKLGGCVEHGSLSPGSNCLFCNSQLSPSAWTSVFVNETLEGGLGTLATSNLTGSKAKWQLSDTRAVTGTYSLYFGDSTSNSYDVGSHAHGRATTDHLVVPEGISPTLNFALWLDTEQTKDYDFMRVLIIRQDGTEEELWHSNSIGGTTEGGFIPVAINLDTIAGQTVQISWEFNTIDDLINSYEGAYIDNIRLTSGCCATDADCDDGNGCTNDACSESGEGCIHTAIETCCNTTVDCDDDNACTIDSCTGLGGECNHQPIADCCITQKDCDDADPCTEDLCNNDTQTCGHQPLCCEKDGDCNDKDKCTLGACIEGQCLYDFICCLNDTECDDGQYCTLDQCLDGDCVSTPAALPGCCVPELFNQAFDSDEDPLAEWTVSPEIGGVGWQVAAAGNPQSPPNALYYGNPVTQNFNSNGKNSGTAVSGPIDLPNNVAIALNLKVYIDAETSNSYDKFWLKVITPVEEITILQKSNLTNKAWKSFVIDLSYLGGQTVQLQFEFDSVDSVSNTGLGLLVDDLSLTTTCEKKGCSNNSDCASKFKCTTGVCEQGSCVYVDSCCGTDEDCNDNQVCTQDVCKQGVCGFNEIPGCCETEAECDDGNPCTFNNCSGYGGQCANDPVPGCCLTNKACDDEDQCSLDVCEDNVCEYQNLCCADASECDDGDDVCTKDDCVDSFCQYTPTGVEGCCEEEPVNWNMEAEIGFIVNQSKLPCTWQITDAGKSQSGTGVLYYGNGTNYDCGANNGTATSPEIKLQGSYGYTLSFFLYMDTESSVSYDKLFVKILAGGKAFEVWNKSKLGGAKVWKNHVIDLNAFAGQAINIEFAFDTKDSIANSGQGVFIDDVIIKSSCAGVTCATNPECNDAIGGTTDTCVAGFCSYSL